MRVKEGEPALIAVRVLDQRAGEPMRGLEREHEAASEARAGEEEVQQRLLLAPPESEGTARQLGLRGRGREGGWEKEKKERRKRQGESERERERNGRAR